MKHFLTILVLTLVAAAVPAGAVTINFDDTPSNSFVPNGYQGFNWDRFVALDPTTIVTPSGYLNGLVSPRNIAGHANAAPATISSATPFSLTSGYFTGAWNDGLTITITGTLASATVFTQSFVVNTAGPSFVMLNPGRIDSAVFSSGGGTHNDSFNAFGPHFVLDNLTINGATVPEPASWAMMMIGFGLVGSSLRRRTTTAVAG